MDQWMAACALSAQRPAGSQGLMSSYRGVELLQTETLDFTMPSAASSVLYRFLSGALTPP